MKNIVEVLKQKERELQQVQGEIEALHVAIRLMSEEGDTHGLSAVPTVSSSEARESRVKEMSTGTAGPRQFP
jgi:hypothetical protein